MRKQNTIGRSTVALKITLLREEEIEGLVTKSKQRKFECAVIPEDKSIRIALN